MKQNTQSSTELMTSSFVSWDSFTLFMYLLSSRWCKFRPIFAKTWGPLGDTCIPKSTVSLLIKCIPVILMDQLKLQNSGTHY